MNIISYFHLFQTQTTTATTRARICISTAVCLSLSTPSADSPGDFGGLAGWLPALIFRQCRVWTEDLEAIMWSFAAIGGGQDGQ